MKTKDISDNPSDHINELSARDYLINALEANLAEKHEGVEQGIVDVSIDELPDPEGINGPEDFKKISAEQMKDGLSVV